jgi:uncharacterized delta-60 repeat protein
VDTSFGNEGIIVFDFAFRDISPNVAALPDNKILYAEDVSDSILAPIIKVLRLMADGSPDSSFGTNGTVTINSVIPASITDYHRDLLIQPDQKILLRTVKYIGANGYNSLLRLNENGSIDSAFGNIGFASIDSVNVFGDPVLKVQPDIKILFLGYSGPPGQLVVARMQSDGVADSAFGVNGIAPVDTPDYISGNTIELQADGKILLGGYKSAEFNFYVARMLNDVETVIEENETFSFLNVFPNPVADQLFIQTSFSPDKEASIIITNSLGQIMKQEPVKFIGDKIKVDVNNLPAGIYLITLKSSADMGSAKFIKN